MAGKTRRMKSYALALTLLFVAVAARADTTPPPAAEETSLQGFGAGNADCLEWNDGCATCLRDADAVHCSVTGIACQPAAVVCTRKK